MENTWAYFKAQEYREFLQHFPIVSKVLCSQFKVVVEDFVRIDLT